MTVVANDVLTENDGDYITVKEYRLLSEEDLIQPFDDDIPTEECSSKIIELEYDKNVTNVKLYYKSGNNWIDISESNQDKLPADAEYQFEISYNYISVDELIAAGGRMVYKDFPDWFEASGKSLLLYEGVSVAVVEEIDGEIIITFDQEWLKKHKGKDLGGSFKINAKIDWHDIPDDKNDRKVPGLNVIPDFEDGLAQKYGSVSLDKSLIVLEKGDDGKYYLKYTLTVKNEDTVVIPDISVKDAFTNAAYIEQYVGVGQTGTTLPKTESGSRYPWEECSFPDAEAGTLSEVRGVMLWEIGNLLPGEMRTLIYYAQIAESYVDNVISNPINNRANVYSGDVLKYTDAESFLPQNDVNLNKEHLEVNISPQGNGNITYKVTITADESNSFQLNGLTLKDSFPEEFRSYMSGDNDTQVTVTIERDQETTSQTVDYANGSFELNDLCIAPGETVTVTYTVSVKNIFLTSNEQIELSNIASVSKGDRVLRNTMDTVTLDKQTWLRKIAGDPLDEAKTVEIPETDDVYMYDGTSISKENDHNDKFIVPEGSIRYQVILNETGQWDLSSASMRDTFSDTEHIKYTGYVQIQLFERAEGASDDLSDGELIAELESSDSVLIKTVWLKVDDMGSFTFHPNELGIDGSTKYTYLLTYYGETQNMSEITSIQLTNHFHIEGKVGVGSGSYVDLPGIEVSVGKVVQGGIKYNANKTSWYYTPSPVYRTVDSSVYSESEFSGDYVNGAFYWVIRVDGDLDVGNATGSGRNTKLSGFYVKDIPKSTSGQTGLQFKRDSVVGVYVGDKGFDFTAYTSFPEFVEAENTGLRKLEGNPQNDKYFSTTKPSDSDYQWYSENTELNGIIFNKKFIDVYDKDTQAVYIVLRTIPTQALPTATNTAYKYQNDLILGTKNGELYIDTATYTHEIRTTMMKESKGAYIIDKDAGTFTNCSDKKGGDWIPNQKIVKEQLPSSGIYATWLLNINNNGMLSGTYDIIDHLPEGMKLAYVDSNNFGNAIKRDPSKHPKTEYIQELNSNPEWKELETENADDIGNFVKIITYYNESTNEIRWRISNFTSSSSEVRREINLRIICKVEDPELVLNQQKNYQNTVDLVAHYDSDFVIETESADVTIYLKLNKDFDWDYLSSFNEVKDGKIDWPLSANQLPFRIDINPYGEDLCDGDTLPTLIDVLSNMELIEKSISVVILDGTDTGTPYTDFTFDVSATDDGQMLTVVGLPDGLPLRLTYKTRMMSVPKKDVQISNKAYWAGYDPPGEPQVSETGKYDPEGSVFTNKPISITITKVDADSHSKKLNGAKFELYEVDIETSAETKIGEGVSNSMGNVEFEYTDAGVTLKYDKVYCIKEVAAPNGYELDTEANCYYFVIVPPNSTLTAETLAALENKYKGLDIWYDSPEYSIVIENKKPDISIDKVFFDKDGNKFTPTSGKYYFGLFSVAGKLLETLTIEYTENGAKYYLDGVPKNSPRFTNYDPETIYQVYELDENNEPIRADRGNKAVRINDIYYKVEYSEETPPDHVTANSKVIITNTETDPPEEPVVESVTLPATGGMGTIVYYIVGCMLILLALFSRLRMRRCCGQKE